MSRRELWLGAALAVVAGLAVRIWATGWETTARPEDAAYYAGVAENLVRGRGLVIDAIWTYATPPLVLPRPAFEIWLPLPTFLAAVPMLLLGAGFAAAQWASIAAGLLVVALAVRLGADVAEELALPRARAVTLTWGTGLAAAFVLPLVLHSVQPDSTMPFAVLMLASTMLMARLLARARVGTGVLPERIGARPLVALGLLLGLAALARNEAAWLALTWAGLAWRLPRARADRLRLIAVPAVAAIAVFAPWAVRDWVVFGNPLPGQALVNALSVRGTDIFAWREPPTLARYLGQGPLALLGQRVGALDHDLVVDLLLLGMPVSVLGLVGLPGAWRVQALRPLIVASSVIFAVTTLVFPVATTWGTFLHAAGAIHVLLGVSALLLVDRVFAALSARRGWTRPIAWTGATLATVGALGFTTLILPTSDPAAAVAARFAVLPTALEAAIPGSNAAPVITDTPIFLATKTDLSGLALPDESPASVLELARTYGARALVLDADNEGGWPEALTGPGAGPESSCFAPVDLAAGARAAGQDPAALDGLVAFRIEEACP
jgi:hypothetical protein